jgi:hypothetical protein
VRAEARRFLLLKHLYTYVVKLGFLDGAKGVPVRFL